MKNLFVSLDQAPACCSGSFLRLKLERTGRWSSEGCLVPQACPRPGSSFVLRGLQHLKLGQSMGLPSCTAEG